MLFRSKPTSTIGWVRSDKAHHCSVMYDIVFASKHDRNTAAYDKFKSTDDVSISLLLQGKARGGTNGEQLANYMIDNIAEVRRDCVVFISPDKADVVQNITKDEAQDIITFRNSLSSTSYGVLDTGYKYQYDKYNDVYRYIPLNGDIAGLDRKSTRLNSSH